MTTDARQARQVLAEALELIEAVAGRTTDYLDQADLRDAVEIIRITALALEIEGLQQALVIVLRGTNIAPTIKDAIAVLLQQEVVLLRDSVAAHTTRSCVH